MQRFILMVAILLLTACSAHCEVIEDNQPRPAALQELLDFEDQEEQNLLDDQKEWEEWDAENAVEESVKPPEVVENPFQ